MLKACADRLRARGIDLSRYDTRANVADIIDLQRALKYTRWNLWGQSYGSRVALEVMRRHPDTVRSAILDGPYPPQIGRKFNWARPTVSMIDRILSRCRATDACNARVDDPAGRFASLLKRMRDNPVEVLSRPGGGLPPMPYRINDVMLMWVVQDALYTSANIRRLPALVLLLAAPDPDKRLLTKLVEDYDLNVYGPYYSHGAAYAFSCNDNPKPDKTDERRLARERPHLKPWIEDMLSVDGCEFFAPGARGTMDFRAGQEPDPDTDRRRRARSRHAAGVGAGGRETPAKQLCLHLRARFPRRFRSALRAGAHVRVPGKSERAPAARLRFRPLYLCLRLAGYAQDPGPVT